jgi:sec-independent protein translocase protein TatC
MRRYLAGATAGEMPFLDHLEELRWRILWSVLAVLAGVVVGFFLVTQYDVLGLLIEPIRPLVGDDRLKYLSPADPFFITLKLALTFGVLVASPFIAWQAWAFFAPALTPREKRALIPAVALSVVMFAAGVALAYFATLPLALRFLMGFQVGALEQSIIASAYLSFVVRLLLAFGIAFQLPVILAVLSVLGIVDSRRLAASRRYALVLATIAASLLTPGDIVSTFLLGIPLLLLYEMGIGLTRLVERGRARAAAAES